MEDKPPPYPGNPSMYGPSQPPPPAAYHPVHQQPPPGGFSYTQQPVSHPPPPPPAHGATQPTQPVVTTTTTVFAVPQLGPSPTAVTCPNCRQSVVSEVEMSANTMAWMCCVIMFLCGLWLCCFIPLCMASCQDATHRCPNCKHVLGKYSQ
ncbi:lipopolysaccharide-induced tumor necrosis factor-alpha factor homolog [Ptychodera flava]|uniref:lipopolysaccharide-induced tumor necrosis factor-alpha factor homolog n=1 Tax=Ptychodera flava TaxID=63121 RepID=UPI00396A19CD